MKITLIPGRELSDDLVRVWTGLLANPDLASPYFHPEFTKAIAAVRRDVEVAVLEADGKIAAFFPFQRGHGGVGRPVGGIISDYHGLICAQNFQFSPRELLTHSRLVAWQFDHLPTSQLSFAPFQLSAEPSPQINLSCGYAAYVQERRKAGSEQIKKIFNLIRRIEREIGPLTFVARTEDAASFKTVLDWKSDQYRRSKNPDLFASGWICQAVNRIFMTNTADWSGVLSVLYAGDSLVAGHFGMQSRQVWHYWFPSYSREAAKYSPGLILLLKMVEKASVSGVRIIDLGKGMSPYKERFMNSSSLLASGRVESSWRSIPRRAWKMASSRTLGPSARLIREWMHGMFQGGGRIRKTVLRQLASLNR
jgi:CelD/BcsL family acetyltransferase involved in cellulose biosynthesis